MNEERGRINVSTGERILSVLSGSALVISSLRHASAGRALMLLGGAALVYRGATGRSLLYEQLGVSTTTEGLMQGVEIARAITIQRPRAEVYQAFRDPGRLAEIFTLVARVERETGSQHRWTLGHGPITVHYRTELAADIPNERVAWRSLPGSDLVVRGEVVLSDAPGDRGTEARVRFHYAPAKSRPLIVVAQLLRRVVANKLFQDLNRLKQQLETGELATNALRRAAAESEQAEEPAAHGRKPRREAEGPMEVLS